MERDGTGQLSTIYTYGNQRINSESYNNLSGLYTYDGRGSVSAVVGSYGDFRASYWYDGLGNVKSQLYGYGAFGSGKKYYGYNAEQYNPVTGNQNLRARQVNIRRQRFLTEDTYLGNKSDILSINRYIYGNGNPLKYKDPDGFEPRIIVNKTKKNDGKEPFKMLVDDKVYFVRNGAEPVFSKNGDNYYEVSDDVKVVSGPAFINVSDNDQYAEDNFYQYTSYITTPNPNTRFIPRKENQIGNVSLNIGIGLGGNIKLTEALSVSAQVRYAGEKDLFYNREFRGVLNTELKMFDTGISMNHDFINKRIYDDYTLFKISQRNKDIMLNFGFEIYLGIGGGFSAHVNLSEIMRRVDNMFSEGGVKNDKYR